MTTAKVKSTKRKAAAPKAAPKRFPLVIDPPTLMRLNWLDAEHRAAKEGVEKRVLQLASLLKAVDPEGQINRLQSEIGSFRTQERDYRDQYIALSAATQARLGIPKSKSMSFDDRTGVAHILDNK